MALFAAMILCMAPGTKAQDYADAFSRHGDPIEATAVTRAPEIYMNKTVFVKGTVDDVYRPNVFTLDQPDAALTHGINGPGHKDLIVVVPAAVHAMLGAMGVEEGTKLHIVGEIRNVTVAEIDDLSDLDDPDDDVDIDIDNKVVMIATAVRIDK